MTAASRADSGMFAVLPPGQHDLERSPLSQLALDRQGAAMAVDDVLDDCESQTRAALVPALRHVDPKEALRQARDVLGRDPWSVIPHRQLDQALSSAGGRCRERNVDSPAALAVFHRVLD